jgi:hypothetical protein
MTNIKMSGRAKHMKKNKLGRGLRLEVVHRKNPFRCDR